MCGARVYVCNAMTNVECTQIIRLYSEDPHHANSCRISLLRRSPGYGLRLHLLRTSIHTALRGARLRAPPPYLLDRTSSVESDRDG